MTRPDAGFRVTPSNVADSTLLGGQLDKEEVFVRTNKSADPAPNLEALKERSASDAITRCFEQPAPRTVPDSNALKLLMQRDEVFPMTCFRGETRSPGAKNVPQTARTTRQNSAEPPKGAEENSPETKRSARHGQIRGSLFLAEKIIAGKNLWEDFGEEVMSSE